MCSPTTVPWLCLAGSKIPIAKEKSNPVSVTRRKSRLSPGAKRLGFLLLFASCWPCRAGSLLSVEFGTYPKSLQGKRTGRRDEITEGVPSERTRWKAGKGRLYVRAAPVLMEETSRIVPQTVRLQHCQKTLETKEGHPGPWGFINLSGLPLGSDCG
jgi:hypothetical protein